MGNLSDIYQKLNNQNSVKPNNTKKGLGELVIKHDTNNSQQTQEDLPKVDLPKVDLPKVDLPKVDHNRETQIGTASLNDLGSYLTLAKNISVNCLKMYSLINGICKDNNEWKRVTREDFLLAGVKGEKISSARLEGKERGLFDYKEINVTNNKTGKTYVSHVLYRLIK